MKKFVLLMAVAFIGLAAKAQITTNPKLNEQQIGDAYNILTVDEFDCNQIDVDSTLNTVMFIHRSDTVVSPAANQSQYRFDVSENGGNTWFVNRGPLNIPASDFNTTVNGRYPQGKIYNPAGNTIPDSAFVVYSGTWHNQQVANTGSWVGVIDGRGNLSGAASTCDYYLDTINNGVTDIATSMCQSVPGTYWVLDLDYTGSFVPTSNPETYGIIVRKGVWNPITLDVDWTSTEIPQQFDSETVSNGTDNVIQSIAGAFEIAFDPTGQYGWISCLGDITTAPVDSMYRPIFWNSTDGGATWNGPQQIILDSLPGVLWRLSPLTRSGLATTQIPTTAFEGSLTVDEYGNPHMLTTVGSGTGYSILSDAGYTAFDIHYNANASPCDSAFQGWIATYVDSVQTLRGTYTTDASGAITEDNRPLISRTPDGKKLFFFWLDSDESYVGSDANDDPNLFTRGFDLDHFSSTPVVNVTYEDSLFGGATTASVAAGINPGCFAPGANFPVISNIAMPTGGGSYNVPLVMTEIDFIDNANNCGNLGLGDAPCNFWYVNNINFDLADFAQSTSVSITLVGPNPQYDTVGNGYVEWGATITNLDSSCHSVVLHLVIDTSGLNTGVDGSYTITYYAEDSAGGIYSSTTRTVVVGQPPVANFNFTQPNSYTVVFSDLSQYNPLWWTWTFGDLSQPSGLQNPTHIYTSTGTYQVCLVDSNNFGTSSSLCKNVSVVASGISQIGLDASVNVYPNPTSGLVTIDLTSNQTVDFTVSVNNLLGQQVMAPAYYKAGTSSVSLDLGKLAEGNYLVKIQSTNGTVTKNLALIHGK